MPNSRIQLEVKELIIINQPEKKINMPHFLKGWKFTFSFTPQLSQLSLVALNFKNLTPHEGQKLDFI